MKIVIRKANLRSDKGLIIDTLPRFLTPLSDAPRFNWLYKNNPHGEAHAWVAYRVDDETVIGMSAAFPRQIYVDGNEEVSWVLGDFCIDGAYRSLGPALMLQRASLAEADLAGVAFCYDFPSSSMMAVYKRLQIAPFAQMIRLAKPLRVDRKMKELIKDQTIRHLLSTGGNFLLRRGERKYTRERGLQVSLCKGDCGAEFSELAKSIGGRYGICIQRSAEYLNWRYVNSPLYQYELFTVRRDGALLGYAVFLQDGEDAMLVDVFGIEEEYVPSALVAHGVAQMAARGVQTVSAGLVEAHPWRALLERQGFKVREVSPFIVYSPSGSESRTSLMKERKWLVMQGDRDS